MKPGAKNNGFSLMEVMFAVVILTLGMIFVSAQFPLGLDISRQAAETTTSAIDTHNAVSMLKLHLGSLNRTTYFGQNNVPPNKYYFMNTTYIPVTNFFQPNQRFDLRDFVMDDPTSLYFLAAPAVSWDYFNITPALPNYLKTVISYTNGVITQYTLSPRNIGQIVSPPVDESDREVQQILNDKGITPASNYALYEPALDDAVYSVAMERTYSWCALYQCLDPPPAGGGVTFRFYIFTLRRSRLNSRYAVQDYPVGWAIDPTFGTNPKALLANQDRVFPVPWYINLGTDAVNPASPLIALDRFPVNTLSIQALLRPGTFLVDVANGFIYRVQEIQTNATYNSTIYNYVVVLREPIKQNTSFPFQYLSLIPPDIVDRSTTPPRFGDNQPVVNVTQQVIRF